MNDNAPAEYEIVDNDGALAEFVDFVLEQERYAIDTEFHRERSYFPRVALLQIRAGDHTALIDPLVVDPKPLNDLFASDRLAVLHAAGQDLEVFQHWVRRIPTRMFDTQVASGFLGLSTPSLSSLHDRFLHISLPKTSRLTDWLARPLSEDQLDYAASDVAHLLELHDRLVSDLTDLGRLDWALDECEIVRSQPRGGRDPEEAWRRIKAVRQLKGKSLGAARLLAAWREEQAAASDQPVRFVLSDLGLVGIAQRQPKTTEQLRAIRGVDERLARGSTGELLLDLVKQGADVPPIKPNASKRGRPKQDIKPAVSLVAAWVAQLASEKRIDASLLATRADVEALVREDEDARLSQGWRATLVGGPIKSLMSGDAALAFEDGGGLVLEQRSRQAFEIE